MEVPLTKDVMIDDVMYNHSKVFKEEYFELARLNKGISEEKWKDMDDEEKEVKMGKI